MADLEKMDESERWTEFVRNGLLLENQDMGNGYIVPEGAERIINAILATASPMRRIAHYAAYGDDLSLPAPNGELYAMPAITGARIDDEFSKSDFDADVWLGEECRDVFAHQESAAFINGDGNNKPRGILSYQETDSPLHSLSFKLNEGNSTGLNEMVLALPLLYRNRASFLMNRQTLSVIRKIKDEDGQYIWSPPVDGSSDGMIFGIYPVFLMEDMPDISSGKPSIALGDFKAGYMIVDKKGIRVLRDPYSAKPYILFYTTKRVGGHVIQPKAIVLGEVKADSMS